MSQKPSILILGGCGFIGRHIVEFLVTNSLAFEIRVVDKTPTQMAWLNSKHVEIFNNPIVEFRSANLINPTSCANAFAEPSSGKWDFVINLAAETRQGQTDPIYQEGVFKLSLNCANECAKHEVKRYVELSSGNMNSNEKTPQTEDSSSEPWTLLAKYKLKVEQELCSIPGLKYTIIRLPVVYGIGDRKGLTPRLLIASLYKKVLGETMKLLWNESMKVNTVHVSDVVNAIWELCNNPNAENQIYNIVDDSESTQGSISELLSEIFNIKVDYWGVIMSNITKVDMSGVIEEINDKHIQPWAQICQTDNVQNSPLTPFIESENLLHKHINLDNTKLKATGYELRVPKLKAESLREILQDFANQGIFPKSLVM